MDDVVAIVRTPDHKLVLQHSQGAALLALAFLSVLFVWALCLMAQSQNADKIPTAVLFGGFLLYMSSRALKHFLGLAYYFDPETRTIKKNKEQIAYFDDVRNIQIRLIEGFDMPTVFCLSLMLHDGDKISLAQTTDGAPMFQVADELADTLGVSVHRRC